MRRLGLTKQELRLKLLYASAERARGMECWLYGLQLLNQRCSGNRQPAF